MKNIIVAYPKKSTAIQLKNVLDANGFYVSHICATGASVLRIADDVRGGVVVCASLLKDMSAFALYERLPVGFDMLALSKTGREDTLGSFLTLPLPLDPDEFVGTVAMLVSSRGSLTERNASDAALVEEAKQKLMHTASLTESQAHRLLQNIGMQNRQTLTQTAKEILKDGN